MGQTHPQAPEQVVRDLHAAITARDFARLRDLLDDRLAWEVCGIDFAGAGIFDKAAILGTMPGMLEVFEEGSPRMTITSLFRDGDWVIAEGTGAGVFRDGRSYENRYVFFHEIVDGRVRTLREYMDTQHMASLFAGPA